MFFNMFFKKKQEKPSIETMPTKNGILQIEETADSHIIYLAGAIDANICDEIKETILNLIEKDSQKSIIFDMEYVNYVSGAGLRMFSAINHKVAETETEYKLINMSEETLKMFKVTGYASAFCIETNKNAYH